MSKTPKEQLLDTLQQRFSIGQIQAHGISHCSEKHLALLRKELDEGIEKLNERVISLAEPYLIALIREFRQRVYTDEYGVRIDNDWAVEAESFYNRFVKLPAHTELESYDWKAIRYRSFAHKSATAGYRLDTIDPPPPNAFAVSMIMSFVEAAAAQLPAMETQNYSDFELKCEELLIAHGWQTERVAGTGDQGADLIAKKNEHLCVIQCKFYQSAAGNSGVQEVFAAKSHYGANAAIVVSSAGFTKSARQLAHTTGVLLLAPVELAQLETLL